MGRMLSDPTPVRSPAVRLTDVKVEWGMSGAGKFSFGKLRKFWRWTVGMVAQQRECT